MYERNAIVLERYFNKKFGYDLKNNLKTNFNDYCELIDQLEVYKSVSDEEENIIKEYDSIADKIRETQAIQESLEKKNQQLQEERREIFRNIDESSDTIRKKTEIVNNNINELNKEIEDNAQKFVQIITEFNEKSTIRTSCERNRRKVENEYNKKLNQTLDDFQDIEKSLVEQAKKFSETDTEDIENELTDKIEKNGEKEKIPFNEEVISKAIILAVDIQKKETDILTNVYDKISKLFNEIKNNVIKTDKHKKIVKDSKVKLEFLSVLKEYLVQFLDNERITAVNGEKEHKALMKEACKNLDSDLKQINNLYTILLKEISNKIGKKTYDELYNYEYLIDLENTSKSFDEKVKKLNLPVTVINPNYWRIDGMRKIYETFDKNVTQCYGRDLSQYHNIEDEEDDDTDNDTEILDEKVLKNDNVKVEMVEVKEEKSEKLDPKSEIDKKIEMILGLSKRNLREEIKRDKEEPNNTDNKVESEKDNWEDDSDLYEFDFGEDDDEIVDEDISYTEEDDEWEDEKDNFDEENVLDDEEDDWENEEDEDIDNEEDNEGEWDDGETDEEDEWNDDWDDEEENNEDEKSENVDENANETGSKENDNQQTPDVDIWGKNINKKTKENDWENEFINIKEKSKEKKGFFNKFKK